MAPLHYHHAATIAPQAMQPATAFRRSAVEANGNKLTSLPKEIGGLEQLERLNLSGNKLTSLTPKEIQL
jgi:hypothetical protein